MGGVMDERSGKGGWFPRKGTSMFVPLALQSIFTAPQSSHMCRLLYSRVSVWLKENMVSVWVGSFGMRCNDNRHDHPHPTNQL